MNSYLEESMSENKITALRDIKEEVQGRNADTPQ